MIIGQIGEDDRYIHLNYLDELFPQYPQHAVLVARCDVGELYGQFFYELLTQTFLVPSQKIDPYNIQLDPVDLEDF